MINHICFRECDAAMMQDTLKFTAFVWTFCLYILYAFGPFQLVFTGFGAPDVEALKAVSKGYLAHLRMELETWKGADIAKMKSTQQLQSKIFTNFFRTHCRLSGFRITKVLSAEWEANPQNVGYSICLGHPRLQWRWWFRWLLKPVDCISFGVQDWSPPNSWTPWRWWQLFLGTCFLW